MKEKSQLTNLQTEIQTRYDSLSKRLKQVAKYILDNSDSIVFDTVAVIAERLMFLLQRLFVLLLNSVFPVLTK